MPSKSWQGRRKLPRSKRGKGTAISPAMPVQQREVAQPDKPVAPPPKAATPSAGVPVLASVRYPYVVTELQRIGILAGIVLVILVVLFLVLS